MKRTLALLLAVAIVSLGCGGNGTGSDTTNSSPANARGNTTVNAANPVAVTTPTPSETTNNAPTLTPVVHAFYDALRNRDDAALKRVIADDFIRSLEADMREENRKGLAAYIAELDKVPDKPVEVRNERIQGDRAVAEIRGGAYVNWTPFGFVRENGLWKFSGESPVLDNVSGQSK